MSRGLRGLILSLSAVTAAHACDPCTLYSATKVRGLSDGSLRFAVAEQFTSFEEGGEYRENSIRDGELVKDFSSTQLSLGYDFTERFGVQANLPLISRRYDRISRYRRSEDTETGFGDASLVAYYAPLADRTGSSSAIWNVFAGIKAPTGDTGSINQSLHSDETLQGALVPKHHPVTSAAGGRVLSLGTGSYDFPVGTSVFLQGERWFGLAVAQYTLRTEGAFDYHFADDLVWNAGPGVFFDLGHDHSIALRAVMSGEHKDRDEQGGATVEGSEVSNLYLGPEVLVTGFERVNAEIGVDIPVYVDDSDSTIVPEYRIRAAVNILF